MFIPDEDWVPCVPDGQVYERAGASPTWIRRWTPLVSRLGLDCHEDNLLQTPCPSGQIKFFQVGMRIQKT